MAWTTPKTYAVEEATSSDLNTYQRDNITHLHDRPCAIVYHSSAQNSSVGSYQAISFDSEEKDTDSMHSTVTNNSRVTLTETGLYVCWANVSIIDLSGAFTVALTIQHSSEAVTPLGTSQITRSGSQSVINYLRYVYTEASSTYVEAKVYQSAGTTTNAIAQATDRFPFFAVCKIRDVLS